MINDYKPKSEAWFLERVGKRIFRDADSCKCLTCSLVAKEGLIIASETHAMYLHDVDYLASVDGTYYNYRDIK